MTAQTIPVLDLKDFSSEDGSGKREAFVLALGEALCDLGFFILVNHGIEQRLIDTAYGAAEAFFALPESTKAQYAIAQMKGQRGFTQFGKEHAKNSTAPDLKEFWHLGRERPTAHPVGYPNNLWPKEVPQFRPTMTALFDQLETCACQLMQACAQYLQQPESFFSKQVTEGQTILRIIHYPPIPADAIPASQRAAPHEDINLITLLCEATTPGLELLQSNGEWLPVHSAPGEIIVDTGDMLQSLSNGLLKSTTHRVTNPTSSRDRRFSMPFFVHPRPDFDLTPLSSCIERTGGNQLFPAQTAEEYLQQRLKEIGLA
ncbi:oxidoreductase, 2OG-Fe(II) oxygenase family [Synechococcus sp. PCC 7335]|uniref:isopenicillin N synthase family dioxygenase n=1 Tax=Synechococcus sp. (strain ATCC 29403 / PCC 7335) TaxID=91464 RepID=UPI00017EC70B|nr:2-oxoglutarate and iron-dependent oxygenase domain-containing protein [Synechococcus sp. PCC 7335]EDX85111.1 oxidoreductase, 2OG-Fe(II) oxygenase family [Synechococcus sp. PCC 7335]